LTAEEKLLNNGYEGVTILADYSYDDALVGVTEDGRAVCDFEKMVDWLMAKEGWNVDEAVEWIEYNTIRALGYFGPDAPVIMYPLSE
jgi:hypothetical protein